MERISNDPKAKSAPRPFTSGGILNALDVIGGDGHSIFDAKAFEGMLPPRFLKALAVIHKSDTRDPKSTLFVEGKAVQQLEGIYGLELLEDLARELDITPPHIYGRGTRARWLDGAIRARIA